MDQLKHTDSQTSRFTASDFCFIGGLMVFGGAYGYIALFKSSFGPGWDSYFYCLQVKTWFETGSLHAFRLNLIYPILIFLQWIINDYVLSYKVFMLISYSFLGVSCYITSRSFRANPYWALTVGLLAMLNPHTIYVASQFSKNLFAMGFFILLVGAIPLRRWKIIIPLFICLALTHKLMLVYGVVYSLVYMILVKYRRIKFWMKIGIPYAIAGILVLGFLLFLPEQIAENFDLPVIRFLKSHGPVMTGNWKVTLVIVCIIPLLNIPFFKKLSLKQQHLCVAIGATYLMMNVPFLSWGPMEYAFRFFMVFGTISIISLSLLRIPDILKYVILGSTLFLSLYSTNTYSPQKHDPPYSKYSFISAAVQDEMSSSQVDLVICHKSLAEFISFESGSDFLPWGIPPNEISSKVYRIVYVPHEFRNQFQLTVGNNANQLTSEYAFLKEQDYQEKWLKSLSKEALKEFKTWRNPYLIRSN